MKYPRDRISFSFLQHPIAFSQLGTYKLIRFVSLYTISFFPTEYDLFYFNLMSGWSRLAPGKVKIGSY